MVRRALLTAALVAGCAYKVRVETVPAGATVETPRGQRLTAPGQLKLSAVPFAQQRFKVSAAGYRTLEGDLRWTGVQTVAQPGTMIGIRRYKLIKIVLVPDHGPAGTWTPDDVGR